MQRPEIFKLAARFCRIVGWPANNKKTLQSGLAAHSIFVQPCNQA